jgi:hypothetical protein
MKKIIILVSFAIIAVLTLAIITSVIIANWLLTPPLEVPLSVESRCTVICLFPNASANGIHITKANDTAYRCSCINENKDVLSTRILEDEPLNDSQIYITLKD